MAVNYQSSSFGIKLVYDMVEKGQISQHFVHAEVKSIFSTAWAVKKVVCGFVSTRTYAPDITIYVISLQK